VRLALVAALLAIVTLVRIAVDQPGLAIAYYTLIPIVLVAFWFGAAATVAARGTSGAGLLTGLPPEVEVGSVGEFGVMAPGHDARGSSVMSSCVVSTQGFADYAER